MVWGIIYFVQYIPIIIIDICEDIKFSMTTQIALIAFMLLEFAGILVFIKFFRSSMIAFHSLLARKLYFLLCTKKGKAICENDFQVIKKVKENLYMYIETQQCIDLCYSICFNICKVLQKGTIEFLAVKKFSPHKGLDDDGKDFTMHVLYVNNGWAFDTYSSRQYPIEKLHEIYDAKVYKTFSFDDICNKSYKEFLDEQYLELSKWCHNNDCYVFDPSHA